MGSASAIWPGMLLANSRGLIKLQKSQLSTCLGPWRGKQGVIKLVPQTQLVGTFTLFAVLLRFLGALLFLYIIPLRFSSSQKGSSSSPPLQGP